MSRHDLHDGDGDDNALEIPLRRPPLWSPGITLTAAAASATVALAAAGLVPALWRGEAVAAELLGGAGLLLFWSLTLALLLLRRGWLRRRPPPRLILRRETISLPASPEPWRQHELPYAAVVAVHQLGRGAAATTVIETEDAAYPLPATWFAEPEGPATLALALRRHVVAVAADRGHLAALGQSRAPALLRLATRPLATQALLGAIAVFFANTALKDALAVPLGLVRWGSNVPALVAGGQIYRLVAANLLHASTAHVLVDAWALATIAPVVERLLGWPALVLVASSGGIAGMAAAALRGEVVDGCGSSGMVFALAATYGLTTWRARAVLPPTLRQPLRWWLGLGALYALLAQLVPAVDGAVHVGGTAAGLVTGAWLVRRRALPPPPGRPLRLAAAAVAVAVALALVQAVAGAAGEAEAGGATTAARLARLPQMTPAALASVAAIIATADDATDAQRATAAAALARARAARPGDPSLLDTAARLAERAGDHEAALSAARGALVLGGPSPGRAAALLRLLQQGRPPPEALRTALQLDPESGTLRLRPVLPATAGETGLAIEALVSRGGRPLALAWAHLGPAGAQATPARAPGGTAAAEGDAASLVHPLLAALGPRARLTLHVLGAGPLPAEVPAPAAPRLEVAPLPPEPP